MQRKTLIHELLTRSIIGAFYEVYNTLGFGFFEHIYSKAMEVELGARGHQVGREVWVPTPPPTDWSHTPFWTGAEVPTDHMDETSPRRIRLNRLFPFPSVLKYPELREPRR